MNNRKEEDIILVDLNNKESIREALQSFKVKLENKELGIDSGETYSTCFAKSIDGKAEKFAAQQRAEADLYTRTKDAEAELAEEAIERELTEFEAKLEEELSNQAALAKFLANLAEERAAAAASTAAFVSSEGTAVAESDMTIGSVTMSPKTLGCFTDVTRQLLTQSSLDVENLIRNDIAQSMALAIDSGALEGSGSSGNPTGIKNTTGINTVTFAGANPTWAETVNMESQVAVDNALIGNLSYIMRADDYGSLKTTEKATGTAQFVVDRDGRINNYGVVVSNQPTAGDHYFGNFSDLLIGFFGGLDIIVDPYTNSSSGTVRVVGIQMIDVAVRNAVSFCLGNDG